MEGSVGGLWEWDWGGGCDELGIETHGYGSIPAPSRWGSLGR
jgi:hypothetical protein